MAGSGDVHGEAHEEVLGEGDGGDRWEELAPGITRRRLPRWDATVGGVDIGTGVLVVDTGSGVAEGARVRDDLAALFGRPVTHVALTHSHFDHVLGTAAFDGAEVYGAEGLAGHLGDGREELRLDAVRHGMAKGPAAEASARLVPPHHGVTGRLTAASGERTVRLVNMGPAHSPYDMAVIVDVDEGRAGEDREEREDRIGGGGAGTAVRRRVVFCGDLVEESGEPQAGPDASPSHWPGALDRLLALGGEDALYVPGHGAVVGADFVRAQRDVLARRFGGS
ncbi:MBL fold metallo-hydrolase [Streptomyces marispadix]|uniref:MBL fold metallo-hydrolase n=1 Tax=Streptomyces marispadix TaxID=2922868 RepID=A0ABS9SVC4_9ACTN|nr:MBL fold metallo-hydrolase [Streptomyces marispadix]MCH6160229.1 MBL fold metallo-hydrolase [Streptomyces marispadix]